MFTQGVRGLMTKQHNEVPPGSGMSQEAGVLYGRIARGEHPDEKDRPALTELEEWGLVGYDPATPTVPVVLDPHEAMRRHLERDLEIAKAGVARMASLPALAEALDVHYAGATWRIMEGSQFHDDPRQVNALLDAAVAGARVEILSSQPRGPREREILDRAVARDTAALERGVRLRTLYRETVRTDGLTAEYARVMSGKGASYRTLVDGFERVIIVDRQFAVFENHLVPDAPAHAAWTTEDRAIIAWMAKAWESNWVRAQVWQGELRVPGRRGPGRGCGANTAGAASNGAGGGHGPRLTERQQAIMGYLVSSLSQPAMAKRLGISTRMVGNELTALKTLFGAGSLPELTHRWTLAQLGHGNAPTTVAGAKSGASSTAG